MLDMLQHHGLLLLIGQYPNGPLGGLALTLILSVAGIALALPVSIGLALALTSPWRALRAPATALVFLVRGVPLLLFIFWVYFAIPALLHVSIPAVGTLLVALVVYESAYLAEVIRAGIEALPKGQTEAARSMGMTYMQARRHIVLSQALYNMLPSMLSQFISTIKETSLGYVISVHELTYSANQLNNTLLTRSFDVYALLALTYFAVCGLLTLAVKLIEHRVEAGRRSAPHSLPNPAISTQASA